MHSMFLWLWSFSPLLVFLAEAQVQILHPKLWKTLSVNSFVLLFCFTASKNIARMNLSQRMKDNDNLLFLALQLTPSWVYL